MKITFTARHFEASPNLQKYSKETVGKLEQFYDRIQSCDIVLQPVPSSTTPQQVEIILKVPKKILKVTESSANYEQAIHDAVENLSRQLKRYKEKSYTNF